MDTFRKKVIVAIVFWSLIIVISVGVYFLFNKDSFGKFKNWFKETILRQEILKPSETEQEFNRLLGIFGGQELARTDFGDRLPPNFLENIPIEEGVKIEQSQELDYSEKKQSTVIFQSKKTAKENYDIYTTFLNKDNWNISQKYEDEKALFLYALKANDEINVAILVINESASTNKSLVSLSIFHKK